MVLGHTGGWLVWFNDGDGTSFTQGGTPPAIGYRRAELADLDGDGDLDVAGSNIGSASTYAMKRTPGQGAGGWTASNQITNLVHVGGLAVGDVDRDGDVDIVFGCYGDAGAGSANKVWRNNGSAFFTDSGQSLGSAYTRDVQLADIDGDGDLDMICGNYQGSGNRIWLNNGAGNFSDAGLSIGTGNTLAIALADVDHDGDLDLVEANGPDERDKIWLNE